MTRGAAPLALSVVLFACGGVQYTPIDVRDDDATALSMRITWYPRKQPVEPRNEGAPSSATTVEAGFEIQHTRMKGADTQTLSAGETMSLTSRQVTGPQVVRHRVDLNYTHIAYSATTKFPGNPPSFELDAFIGIGQVDFRLHSDASVDGPDALGAHLVHTGMPMGVGLRWWFVEKSALEGRLLLFTGNPLIYLAAGAGFGNGSQTDLWQAELVWVFAPIKYLAIRAGFATLDYTPKKRSGESIIESRLSGPFLGLALSF
jgi:hypothetical protein